MPGHVDFDELIQVFKIRTVPGDHDLLFYLGDGTQVVARDCEIVHDNTHMYVALSGGPPREEAWLGAASDVAQCRERVRE